MPKTAPDLLPPQEAAPAPAGEIGYGPPRYPREEVLGSELHKRMIAIAMPRTSLRYSIRDKLTRRGLHKLFHIFVRHHGWRRLRNFLRYLRQREKRADVTYMPPQVVVDVHNRCNLKCPGCATGLGLGRERGSMDLGMVKSVVDQLADSVLQLGFFHWSEPLLNKTTYEAVGYARQKGLWTVVSSNLSFKLDKWLERIFECGLHDIVISCDGVTQDVYERYRAGGDVDLVWENVRRIRKRRDELGRRTPYLRAKMILFEHNWHEIEAFREKALACGADEVQYAFGYGGESYTTGVNGGGHYFDIHSLQWARKEPRGACTEIWREMFFSFDGAVFSCCLGYRDDDLFEPPPSDGEIDVRGIWTNESYRAARAFFLGQGGAEALPPGCRSCKFVTNFEPGGDA